MKAWSIPIVMATVLAGTVTYASIPILALNSTLDITTPDNTIPGLKRWPGTWNEETIKVDKKLGRLLESSIMGIS